MRKRQRGLDECELRHRGYEPVAPPWHGFDIAGLAGVIGDRLAEALEILVARPPAIAVPDIVVAAIDVALPDLDPRPSHRPPVAVENAACDSGHRSLCRLGMPRDMDEIVVGIGGVTLRIERPFGLGRGRR